MMNRLYLAVRTAFGMVPVANIEGDISGQLKFPGMYFGQYRDGKVYLWQQTPVVSEFFVPIPTDNYILAYDGRQMEKGGQYPADEPADGPEREFYKRVRLIEDMLIAIAQ